MATRLNHELPPADADEEDAFSSYARQLTGMNTKPGVAKSLKRKYNKRVRKQAKRRIQRNHDDWD